MFCSKCGVQIGEGANFCALCGAKKPLITNPVPEVSVYIAPAVDTPHPAEVPKIIEIPAETAAFLFPEPDDVGSDIEPDVGADCIFAQVGDDDFILPQDNPSPITDEPPTADALFASELLRAADAILSSEQQNQKVFFGKGAFYFCVFLIGLLSAACGVFATLYFGGI